MPDHDILKAELERLFELDELLTFTREVLGFDPEAVGDTYAKAPFAAALAAHCANHDATDALTEALLVTRPEARLVVEGALAREVDEEPPGSALAGFENLHKLAESPLAVSYVGRRGGTEHRIKVYRAAVSRDRRSRHLFSTVVRLMAPLAHPGLPRGLTVGLEGSRLFVAHEHVPGTSLAARLRRTGPTPFSALSTILREVLQALAALHARRMAHGNLRLENVIVTTDGEHVVLVDAGGDRWRDARSPFTGSSPVAPEQLRGRRPDAQSDLYAVGALAFELLTGRPPFDATDPVRALLARLTEDPEPPSRFAPRGFVPPELDALVQRLLANDPSARPADATALLRLLDAIPSVGATGDGAEASQTVEALLTRLVAHPDDAEAALALESAATGTELTERAGTALLDAARTQDGDPALMYRAARVFASRRETFERAEATYVEHLARHPEDAVARSALRELRWRAGKFDEVVDMLLADAESASSPEEKSRSYADIGAIYARDLDDPEQALVAYTQAFCENPRDGAHAAEIERLAGTRPEAWAEVLQTATSAAQEESRDTAARILLYAKLGRWWLERAQRPDVAASCFQALLALEPSHEAALDGLCQIYRRAQQWPELAALLVQRAEASAVPARARDHRAEAAEILEVQLEDTARARALYEQVVAEDPGHPKAAAALARLYQRSGDAAALVALLEKGLAAKRGDERAQALCRIAEVYDTELGDAAEAARRYGAALEADAACLDALRGLERLHARSGRYRELLDNLLRQVELAATPRQKIALLERVASLHEQEFLDPASALGCLEQILSIDPAHAAALSGCIRLTRALERWDDAASLYERWLPTLGTKSEKVEALLELAELLLAQARSPERAIRAYERVLELAPEEPRALDALARLRESEGDAERALRAVEALAEHASTPEAQAEQWIRAARLLAARGDREGAIDRYKRALDQNPRDRVAATELRAAYLASGDVAAALALLEREIEETSGDLAKSALLGQLSTLCRTELRDHRRAEEAAKRALALDPTNVEALTTLGEVAVAEERFAEASTHFGALADRALALDPEALARVLLRYAEALCRAGSGAKAVEPMERLLRLRPEDPVALERAAELFFDHGSPERAAELYGRLAQHPGLADDPVQRARALGRHGEALRRAGKLSDAVPPLQEAADLDPTLIDPLIALGKIHEAEGRFEEAIQVKLRHLDVAAGDERIQLLLDVAELAGNKLGDRTRAAKSLVAALEERPDDRRLLMKLMQLYSEEKDWNKLVEVVLRLADFVDDPKQRVKYLHTAAIVTARQIGDTARALEYYEQVLALEPAFDKAIAECVELRRKRGDFPAVERLLKRKLELARAADDVPAMVETFDQLSDLYEQDLGWTEQAIDAAEAARTLDPNDAGRATRLRRLYGTDPERYLDKAVEIELAVLRAEPYDAQAYRTLRRLYTEAKRADEAWCLCQALSALSLAEPDEERFFKRMRADTAAPAATQLDDEAWLNQLMHPDADPLLTSVFALIEPAVIARRGASIADLGYDEAWLVDVANHPAPLCQSLYYAAGVLGIPLPPCFENPNDPGGISFLFAHEPSLVLGVSALRSDVPLQPAAFIAAQKLAYLRPGMYVRHLLASGTALKAWLFGAIKLISPAFPVATELEGAVQEARDALDALIQGPARDHLARVVSKLLTSGAALDLKRWVMAIDLSADRAGFLLAHDLPTALDVIRASNGETNAPAVEERVKELVLYSVSPEYLALRKHLQITVDS